MGRFGFNFTWGDAPPVPDYVERDAGGNWWYEIRNLITGQKKTLSEKEKLRIILSNPAAMKVFKLNCDLYSLGKVNRYEDNVEVERDFLYGKKKKPNFYQSWTQFHWDGMFWRMTGTAYMYRTNNAFNESTQLYWLNPANIDWGDNADKKYSTFTFSQKAFNDRQKETITYTWPDGSSTPIPLSNITPFFDTSNGISGNWYRGESVIDALYSVIQNNNKAVSAQGTNLEFSEKFFASGQMKGTVTELPMSEPERQSAENAIRSGKKVHATKSPVELKRFVDNISNLKLSDAYFDAYFIIGSMFSIPKDILESNLKSGSTYENQEKAMGRHVEYSFKPTSQDYTDALEELFGWSDIRMSWSHLSFNQVFEKDRADRQTIQLANLEKARELGVFTDKEVQEQGRIVMTA